MFHNDTSNLNDLWYESHRNLIASVCVKLKKEKDITELVDSLLGPKPKTKKLKDPLKPKRSKSSYLFFCTDIRESVTEELKSKGDGIKGITISEVSKKLGSIWKTISDDDKAKYAKMADDDKDRYKMEMDNYAS